VPIATVPGGSFVSIHFNGHPFENSIRQNERNREQPFVKINRNREQNRVRWDKCFSQMHRKIERLD